MGKQEKDLKEKNDISNNFSYNYETVFKTYSY